MITDAPRIRLVDFRAVIHDTKTRMPFRYGIACMTSAPSLHLELTIEDSSGKTAKGISADGLPPRWFDKDPDKTLQQNVEDQIAAMKIARDVFLENGKTERVAHEHWLDASREIYRRCAGVGLNDLTASFGSSFLERAMIDALARLEGLTLFECLKRDRTAFPGSTVLGDAPLTRLGARHTVGLADPIRTKDIAPEDKLDDDLPQSLEDCIARYGLYYFKVKVQGDHEKDTARLGEMAKLFAETCRRDYRITLDGNEQYRDVGGLIELLDELRTKPAGQEFVDAILFIEQPLSRDLALETNVADEIRKLDAIKPVIIDESDASPESFQRAVELGYKGVSHKNCKGIFKSLRNRARIVDLNAKHGEGTYFQSAEDLANLPVIPLQEDLAMVAALGIEHVERNGHHYFHGLDHLPHEEAESALKHHPDLYHRLGDSICLRIEQGDLSCGSLQKPGFGYTAKIVLDERQPLDEWRYPEE